MRNQGTNNIRGNNNNNNHNQAGMEMDNLLEHPANKDSSVANELFHPIIATLLTGSKVIPATSSGRRHTIRNRRKNPTWKQWRRTKSTRMRTMYTTESST